MLQLTLLSGSAGCVYFLYCLFSLLSYLLCTITTAGQKNFEFQLIILLTSCIQSTDYIYIIWRVYIFTVIHSF